MPAIQDGDPYGTRTRVFAVNSKKAAISEPSSAFAPETAPNLINGMRGRGNGCTATEHRCVALALAFFDIMAAGEIGELTFAPVAACEAERKSHGS
jgi:hypothetical protein